MSGTLEKKADLKNAWNPRYVELRGPWLTYWGAADKKRKKGEVHVGKCTVRKDTSGPEPSFVIIMANQHQHVHAFRVGKVQRTGESELERWIEAVKKAARENEMEVADGVVDVSHLHDVEDQEDQRDGGTVDSDMLTWCLVFRIDHSAAGEVPVEALEVARNLASAHLHVEDRLSKDHARLFLLVGARESDMVYEATKHCDIDMRLRDIQGTHRFHKDLTEMYAPPLYGDGRSVFTSAQRQVLTKSIMFRLAGEDLDERVHVPNRSRALKRLKKRVEKQREANTWRVEQVLELYGSLRPTAQEDLPSCWDLVHRIRGDLDGKISPHEKLWPLLEKAVDEMVQYDEEGASHFCGHMTSYFPLHCDAELQPLIDRWSTFSVFKKLFVTEKSLVVTGENGHYHKQEPSRQVAILYQPLDEIRDYFGEPTALYFTFAGMYCRSMFFPALLSMIAEFFHRFRLYPQWVIEEFGIEEGDNSIDSNLYIFPYSVFLAVWAIMLLEMWKRREWELKFMWGSEGFEKDEQPRPQFEGVPQKNPLTEVVTMVYGNMKSRVVKIVLSFLLTAGLMGLNGVLLFQAIIFRNKNLTLQKNLELLEQENGTFVGNLTAEDVGVQNHTGIVFIDRYFYSVVAGVMNLTIIVVFGFLYDQLAVKLNNWENHRTQTEWEDALTIKSFLFQFVNNYFTLFYVALLRQFDVINPFGDAFPCEKSSCMEEITAQLIIIFCGKIFLAKIADTARPFVKKAIALRVAKLKVSMHIKQMDKVRALLLLDDGDELEAQRAEELEQFQRIEHEADEGLKITDPFELQERRPPAESLFDNFSDLSIEFGYISFFSPAFPLACLLAFVANLIDLRSDSLAICRGFRRVQWQHAEDIGSWYQVLSTVSFIAVISNACLLGFVSTQMAARNTPEEDDIEHRFRSYKIWIGVIGFEHFVLMLKLVLGFAMPDEPRWLDGAKDQLAYHRKNVLLTKKQQEEREVLRKNQEESKKEGRKKNEALIKSTPKKNESLDKAEKGKKKKKKKDKNLTENKFGGGRVGKVGGSRTPNPMQDMVRPCACPRCSAFLLVEISTWLSAPPPTHPLQPNHSPTPLVRAGACDDGQRRRV
jgi:hypothetical protein